MIIFGTVLAICCLGAAKATPSHWGSASNQQLEGVPDLETYAKISYPKYDILDLGEYSKGHVPGDEIKITKESKITIPQPYPVKIPVPQPYPVHIDKPYPVHETKIVKVPIPVPQIIEKKVPYPVEVPKPYPVPVHTHSEGGGGGSGGLEHLGGGGLDNLGGGGLDHLGGGGGGGGGGGYGGDIGGGYGGDLGGHQALEGDGYGVQEQHAAELPSNEGYESGFGGGNFSPYDAKSLEGGYGDLGGEQGGWQPLGGSEDQGQYH